MNGQTESRPALYESIDEWLTTKRLEGRSDKTCECYRQSIDKLAVYLGHDPKDATTQEIRAWLASLRPKNSNVSINNNRRNLNSYYAYLEDEGEIARSPMRKIHHIKEEKLVKKPFTDEEMELIRNSAQTTRERAMVAFLSSTGCRVGELVGVLTENVNMAEREVKVYGKGGKERVTFFDAKCKLALELYMQERNDQDPHLFVSRRGLGLTTGAVEGIIRKIGQRAGVENCHPHRFRRTVATRAIEHGMPIEQVKELLGHSQIQTTMIYAAVSHESVKTAHRRFLQ